MKRAGIWMVMAVISMLAGCTTSTRPVMPKPLGVSEEMRSLLAERVDENWDFHTADLPELKADVWPERSTEKFEVYRVPQFPHMADTYLSRVILERGTSRFWVVKSGGYAGDTHVYGPGRVGKMKRRQ
ncbi:MAG: hypothetical protein QM755_03115 [Luteolibacter sp.]